MLTTLLILLALPTTGEPISLHPANPHYFLFRGKPTVLITSAEHYGAVLNGDFDAIPYLDELHARGLNLTRTFSGTYREVPGSFKIEEHAGADPSKYIAPWPRTDVAGTSDGGNRFDLVALLISLARNSGLVWRTIVRICWLSTSTRTGGRRAGCTPARRRRHDR